MTDTRLLAALTWAVVLERDARAAWQAPETGAVERDAALDTVRHVTPLIRSLEKWTAARQPATQTA